MRFFILLLALCLCTGFLSAQELEMGFPPPPPPPPLGLKEETIFRVVEVMPVFPYDTEDCPDGIRITCGLKAQLAYLQENVYYPVEALSAGIEGMAVVSFVVEPNGQITNAQIVRNPGAGTGEEALRVVKQMNKMDRRWMPGTQRGRAVHVQYNLPVKFEIGITKERPLPQQDSVYAVVDIAPLFPGSQSGCVEKPGKCSQDAMITYIYHRVNYPDEAVMHGIYGMSVVKLVVEKDGTMSDLRVVRDPGMGIGDEALRVVQSIADENLRWTPGEIDGKSVRTNFAIPIKFALSKKQIKEAKKRAKFANEKGRM